LFEDQLACADMVVVSKTDQMVNGDIDTVLGGLSGQTRSGVHFLRSSADGLSAEVLLGLGIAAEDDIDSRHEVHHHHHDDDDDSEGGHEHEHGHDEFETFALTLPEIADANAFAENLADVIRSHDILRLKGFAAVAGKPMRLVVQAVGPRIETYFDRPFGPARRETRLVVIGEAGLDQAVIGAAIEAALAP
jgi:cobalamin biosynthesis protein CobW